MNKLTLFTYDVLKGRQTLKFFNEFEKTKTLSYEDLKDYQFTKLKKLLEHAEKNVPLYQQRFQNVGFKTELFTDMEQFAQIPILTRNDLQNNWRELIAVNFSSKKLYKGASSGSSGFPILYYKDAKARSAGQAANYLGWEISGWQMKMKGLHIWGNPETVNKQWKKLSSKLKAKIFGLHKFPAYKLTSGEKFGELFELLNKNKYDYIDGYTNAIYLFADFLQRNNLTLKNKIKVVLTTAENLHDHQRYVIEDTIAPVFDVYGCSEINGVAYQCSKCKHYHIIDPHVYLKLENNIEGTSASEILITDLDNYAFPLINYQNGDLGIPIRSDAPECEIKFSRIAGISGRQSDIIKFKDGGTLSVPSFFGSMLLKKIDGLKQYQIEKVNDNLLHINFVKSQEFSHKDLEIVERALKEYLTGKIDYKINFVDKIEESNTGKFKLLIDKTAIK